MSPRHLCYFRDCAVGWKKLGSDFRQGKNISLFWKVQSGTGAYTASYSKGTVEHLPRGKAAAARILPLTSIWYQGYEWSCNYALLNIPKWHEKRQIFF